MYLVVQYTYTQVDTVHVSVYNSTSMPSKLVIQGNTAGTHSWYIHSPFVSYPQFPMGVKRRRVVRVGAPKKTF